MRPTRRELTKKVLEEAHHSKMTIYPGGGKMYKDIKKDFLLERHEEGRGRFRF